MQRLQILQKPIMQHLRSILLGFHGCISFKSFRQIQAQLLTSNFLGQEFAVTRAAEFLAKHAAYVDHACDFLNHTNTNLTSFPFNILIGGYAKGNEPQAALYAYKSIGGKGFFPDRYTFPLIFQACTNFLGGKEGEEFHAVISKKGFLGELPGQNALLHLYGACGKCDSAMKVFDDMTVRDVVSWTCIISGYVKSGLFDEAVSIFSEMDVEPNGVTCVSVLVACGRLGFVRLGKAIHAFCFKRAIWFRVVVGNAVIDMYVKCECLCEAKRVFDELCDRDIVSWTSIISGLVQCGRPKDALELFWDMQVSGVGPDKIILTSVLSACASLGTLDYGVWVHKYMESMNIRWDVVLGTALVHMYAKCGCIEMALHIFHGMPKRNVLTWNALLGGLAMHGKGHEAMEYFELMSKAGIRPNEVTFLAILTGCCHSGLVDEGREYFSKMIGREYNLHPKIEHYGCLVDLLCKARLLNEAEEIITGMPTSPDAPIWGTFLSACKITGNVDLSEKIFDRLLELKAHESGVYVLLSNIYSSNERWNEVTRIRRSLKAKGISKEPGSSVIEVNGKAHYFLVGDASHPQSEDIRILLSNLSNQINLEGNVQTLY